MGRLYGPSPVVVAPGPAAAVAPGPAAAVARIVAVSAGGGSRTPSITCTTLPCAQPPMHAGTCAPRAHLQTGGSCVDGGHALVAIAAMNDHGWGAGQGDAGGVHRCKVWC